MQDLKWGEKWNRLKYNWFMFLKKTVPDKELSSCAYGPAEDISNTDWWDFFEFECLLKPVISEEVVIVLVFVLLNWWKVKGDISDKFQLYFSH